MHAYKRTKEDEIIYVMELDGDKKIHVLCSALEPILNSIVHRPNEAYANNLKDNEEEALSSSTYKSEVT